MSDIPDIRQRAAISKALWDGDACKYKSLADAVHDVDARVQLLTDAYSFIPVPGSSLDKGFRADLSDSSKSQYFLKVTGAGGFLYELNYDKAGRVLSEKPDKCK